MNPIGPRQNHTLSPQTDVLVFDPPEALKAYIIGVIPHQTADMEFQLPSVTQMGGNSGFRKTEAFRELVATIQDTEGLSPANSGRSMDGSIEEWFVGSETGTGIFQDSFQTWMRASELAGLYFNYFDDYVRLVAENYDFFNPSTQIQLRNDEGEILVEKGSFTYPWESKGQYSSTETELTEHEAEKIQLTDNYPYGPVDVPEDATDIEPVIRSRTYEGYLGQGLLHQIVRPASTTGLRDRATATEQHDIGLLEVSEGLNGALNVKSAKSIRFEKSRPFPVHRRLKASEDGEGDNDSVEGEYNFSGIYGKGREHKVLEWNDEDLDKHNHLAIIAAQQDRAAHADKWGSGHPFEYHEKDFTAPTEEEFNGTAPTFLRGTKATSFVPQPASDTITIDHRTGEHKYFHNGASFEITDDGSIILESGYGSRLVLGPMGIQAESSGDINLFSGSRVVTQADEVITKSLTATDNSSEGSMRLKAETNLHMLGANSGNGGILLESKSTSNGFTFEEGVGDQTSAGGITLLSKDSNVNLMGSTVFAKSLGTGIVLDAGDGVIVQKSGSAVNYVDTASAVMTPPDEDGSVNGFLFGDGFTKLSGSVYSDGSIGSRRSNPTHSARAESGSETPATRSVAPAKFFIPEFCPFCP